MRWVAALILVAAPVLAPVLGPVSAQEFTTLKGHGGPVMGLSVSPDGQVASASFDNSVGVWTDGVPGWLEGHAAAVISVDFSEAPLVVSGSDDFRVLAWSPILEDPLEITRHQGKVAGIALKDRGLVIATAGWDGSFTLRRVLKRFGHKIRRHPFPFTPTFWKATGPM